MQSEQKLGAGSNQQTLSSENAVARSESALARAGTAYENDRIEWRRVAGSTLEDDGISFDGGKSGASGDGSSSLGAKPGVVEAGHLR